MPHAPETTDSVYDFLYVDNDRIALYLSQFDQHGHLTTITKSVSTSDRTTGTLNSVVAKAEGMSDTTTALAKHFDTQWVAPLLFLDRSNQRGMIKRELSSANLGQIVLSSGKIDFYDPTAMKDSLAIASIKKLIQDGALNSQIGNHNSLPAPLKKKKDKEFIDNFNLAFDMLKILPHSKQLTIRGEVNTVWCSLNSDCLIGTSSDLMLKYGANIPGCWHVVGILDAKPESGFEADEQQEGSTYSSDSGEGVMAQFYTAIAPLARTVLGRPNSAYGVTPLLIFREVLN